MMHLSMSPYLPLTSVDSRYDRGAVQYLISALKTLSVIGADVGGILA